MKGEFFRLFSTGYGFGKLDAGDEIARALGHTAETAFSRGPTLFEAKEIARVKQDAYDAAGNLTDEIVKRLEEVFGAAGGPIGPSAATPGALESQMASVFDRYLEPNTVVVFAETSIRRMKIQDRGAWIKWQKTKEPPTKWLKSEMKRRANRARPLRKDQLETRCLTGYSKWYNAGQYRRGYNDPNVEAWLISVIRDGHECLVCRALDQVIRPKTDDAFWARYTPPEHWRCRCRLVAIVSGEDWKATLKSYFQGLNPQTGFGGTAKKMDVPGRFKTAKNLTPVEPGI